MMILAWVALSEAITQNAGAEVLDALLDAFFGRSSMRLRS